MSDHGGGRSNSAHPPQTHGSLLLVKPRATFSWSCFEGERQDPDLSVNPILLLKSCQFFPRLRKRPFPSAPAFSLVQVFATADLSSTSSARSVPLPCWPAALRQPPHMLRTPQRVLYDAGGFAAALRRTSAQSLPSLSGLWYPSVT